MFPKCSLDVRNISTLREHLANIPGILRPAGKSLVRHNYSRKSYCFNEVVGRKPKHATLLKKRLRHRWKFTQF